MLLRWYICELIVLSKSVCHGLVQCDAYVLITVELPLTSEALMSYSYNFLKLTQPDDEQYKAVEKAIRQQSSSKWWREEHYSRLTASNFGRVILC